jgi:hypothetical protein
MITNRNYRTNGQGLQLGIGPSARLAVDEAKNEKAIRAKSTIFFMDSISLLTKDR